MEPYEITATVDTPEVSLNAGKGTLSLARMSLPEDAVEFYSPILQWVSDYCKSPNPQTVFNMKLEYFNTASSKQLIQILLLLQGLQDKSVVIINWYYKEIDEDMQGLGEEFSQIINMPFNLIPVAKFDK